MTPRANSGFTALELLAVVVLATLAAGALTARVAATGELAAFRADLSRVRDLDARARLLARGSGPLLLSEDASGRVLTVRQVATGETLIEVRLGAEVRASIDAGAARRWVLFDRLGRSADYEVALERGTRSAHWRVGGATGWLETRSEAGS